jgi:hypothetical protein
MAGTTENPESTAGADGQHAAIESLGVSDPKHREILRVQNVALATAEALQRPSPFTKSMFKVG